MCINTDEDFAFWYKPKKTNSRYMQFSINVHFNYNFYDI